MPAEHYEYAETVPSLAWRNPTRQRLKNGKTSRSQAEILSENARDVDLVARVGGEEFAWIMPETDDAGAFSAVERMREAFAAEAFPGIGCATVSVGLRMVTDTSNPQSVMGDADRALYAAKAGGRNATVVYAEDPQVILGRALVYHVGRHRHAQATTQVQKERRKV